MKPEIYTALYGIVDSMLVSNGLHYDWRSTKAGSRYFSEKFRPSLHIALQDGAGDEYEENNAQGNNEYGIDETIVLTGRIPVTEVDVSAGEIPYEASIAQAKGFEDIMRAFAVPGPFVGPVLDAGAVDMWYQSHQYISDADNQRYNTMSVQVTLGVKYFLGRGI